MGGSLRGAKRVNPGEVTGDIIGQQGMPESFFGREVVIKRPLGDTAFLKNARQADCAKSILADKRMAGRQDFLSCLV